MRRALVMPVLLAAFAVAGCGERVGQSPDPDARPPGWEKVATLPVAARQSPLVVARGNQLWVLGGEGGAPCPPTADCAAGPDLTDGAVLDLETGTWRVLRDVPAGVDAYAAVLGDVVYYRVGDHGLRAFDLDEPRRSWAVATEGEERGDSFVADGARLIAYSGSDEDGAHADYAYAPSTGHWTRLPDDPLGPSFDRVLTPTPDGLVLTAKRLVPDPGVTPSFVRAAVLDRATNRWRTLPDSDQIGGWRWHWTGDRLVDTSLGGADGGESNGYGRTIPYGGVLDPATGAWSRLPHAPKQLTGGWPVEAADGPQVAAEGYLYDDDQESWRRVPHPDGAPQAPGPATWSGGRLVVVGGVYDDRGWTEAAVSRDIWAWEPNVALQ